MQHAGGACYLQRIPKGVEKFEHSFQAMVKPGLFKGMILMNLEIFKARRGNEAGSRGGPTWMASVLPHLI